jgi:hypothetical protein
MPRWYVHGGQPYPSLSVDCRRSWDASGVLPIASVLSLTCSSTCRMGEVGYAVSACQQLAPLLVSWHIFVPLMLCAAVAPGLQA